MTAAVFDLFGVLIRLQPPQDVERIARLLGGDPRAAIEAYWRSRPAFDRGELADDEYWSAVRRDLNAPPPSSSELRELREADLASWSHSDDRMVGWIERLVGEGCPLGLVSNVPQALRDHLETTAPWLDVFDFAVYSCELGISKPDEAVFAHTRKLLKKEAREVLYIDDRIENVDAATRSGFRAVHYVDRPRLRQYLGGIGWRTLP